MAVIRKTAYDLRVTDTLTDERYDYLLNRKSVYNIPPLTIEAQAAEVPMSPGQPLTAAGGVYTVRDVRGLFLIPVDDFAQGAGQESYDTADASPARFMASRYLDVSTPGQAVVGMSRSVVENSDIGGTYTLLAAGGYLWATTTSGVVRIDQDGVATDCTGLETEPVQALASDGEYVYAAQTSLPGSGNDGSISRCKLDETAFSLWSNAENVVGLVFRAGTMFAVRSNWYNGSAYVTQGGFVETTGFTAVTSAGTLFPNVQHRGLCAVESEAFWLVANDEQAWVQAWTPEAGSFRNAYTLPDGFVATAIHGYMGAVYIGGYFEDANGVKSGSVYIGTLDTSVSSAQITKLCDLETNPDYPSESEAVRGIVGHRRHLYIITDSNLHRWSIQRGGISHVCRASVPADVVPVPPDFVWSTYDPQVDGLPKDVFTRTNKAGMSMTKDYSEVLISRDGGGVAVNVNKDTGWVQYRRDLPTLQLQNTFEVTFAPGYFTEKKADGKVTEMLTSIVTSQGLNLALEDGSSATYLNVYCTKPTLVTVKKNKRYRQKASVYVQVGVYDAGKGTTSWKKYGPYDPVTAMSVRLVSDAERVAVFKDQTPLLTLQRAQLAPTAAKGFAFKVGPGPGDSIANKARIDVIRWNTQMSYAPSWSPTMPQVNSLACSRGRVYCPLSGGYLVTDPATPHVPTDEDPCYVRLSKSTFHMNGVEKGFYALWVDHSKLQDGQDIRVSYVLDDSPATVLATNDPDSSTDTRSLFLLQQSGNRFNAQVELVDEQADVRDETSRLRVYGVTSAFVVPTITYYTFNILGYDRTEDRSGGLWGEPADEAIDFLFEMAGVGRVVNFDLGYDSFMGVIKSVNEQPGSRQDNDTSAHQGVVSVKVQRL